MENRAKYYIRNLKLSPHPEGGFYKEIYRSAESINESALPSRYQSSRNFATLIYFLLEKEQKSNFHKLVSDESWHHIDGCSLTIHCIEKSGTYYKIILGKDLANGEHPQYVIPKDTWFAAELNDKSDFALVGCSVFPGFEFEDFTLADKKSLTEKFQEHIEIISKFTL